MSRFFIEPFGLELNWIQTSVDKPETVVLIHAVGHDLTYWDRQMEALAPHFNVVAFDLPGHGSSTGDAASWSFDYAAALVASLIEHVSSKPVHLIGLSFGSMIAQATVLARPDLIRSLVLIGTASDFPNQAREALKARANAVRAGGMAAVVAPSLERWFTAGFRSTRSDVMDRLEKTLLRDDPLHHAAIWDLISTLNLREHLGRIRVPALVLVGEQDASTPPEAAKQVADAIPAAKLEVLPGAAHIVTIEAPHALNQSLENFLSAPSGRS